MWSDNEAQIDLLRFNYLASGILQIINDPHLLPTTIGVFGDWGSGKSTLLHLVQSRLNDQDGVLQISFNGWLFEGYDDAKTALMGTILDALEDYVKAHQTLPERATVLVKKLLGRVNWMQGAGVVARYGVPALLGQPHLTVAALVGDIVKRIKDAPPTGEDAAKIIKQEEEDDKESRKNLREFRKDFAELLQTAEIQTLVVFIDDLDRCLPDTVIETLEAIKLFLFVPHTAFVLAADERLIEYAVRQRFPELPGTETEVGRDYLEKLVQIPVRIPILSVSELTSYMNLLFAEKCLTGEQYEQICSNLTDTTPDDVTEVSFDIEKARKFVDPLPAELQNNLDLIAQISPILSPGLGGNPRRTKRFLNTLLLRMAMSVERGLKLEQSILAKLMILEYMKPEFFKQFAGLQSRQSGKPEEIRAAEKYLTDVSSVVSGTPIPAATESKAERAGASSVRPVNPASNPKKASAELPPDVQVWMADDWMKTWLSLSPSLSDVDLRPYFYIAHDRVGVLEPARVRLSPQAREVLDKLLDSKELTQNLGLRRAKELSETDASAVFQNFVHRIRQGSSEEAYSVQPVLHKLAQQRPDLIPELLAFYNTLPDTKVTLAVPSLLLELTKTGELTTAARDLVERWKGSSSKPLATAAKAALGH